MSDEVLRSKVKDLLEKMERVFKTEWRKTKLNLDHEMIEHFIDPKGTFFEPDGPNTQIPWVSRDELLISFRSLLEEFSEDMPAAESAENTGHSPTDEVVAAAVNEATTAPSAATPAVPPVPSPNTSAIPAPQTASQPIPGPASAAAQWPGQITAPVAIQTASAQGFHNPFAAAVEKKDPPKGPASMQGPDTGKKKVVQDPAALRAIACREKFAELLNGVQSEEIRDFILAEGTNSGTGKPTIIIYTLEQIWLEFAFPYEEGSRILNKYPQRDAELIEFMKAAGHSS